MDLRSWLQRACERLELAGVEGAGLDAQMLAAHHLGVGRSWVMAHPEASVDPGALEPLLSRRAGREPLAYILGWREFYGRRFAVGPGVLVPRQETELLVEIALERGDSSPRILDLGTGSGCIAITLKLERAAWSVVGSDLSRVAIDVADKNAHRLGADVHLVVGNALDAFQPDTKFDLIVCNPPYIDAAAQLMPEVGIYEPSLALRAGLGGLDFFKRLAADARRHLASGGELLVELGAGQVDAAAAIFQAEGYTHLGTREDLAGIPRVARIGLPADTET